MRSSFERDNPAAEAVAPPKLSSVGLLEFDMFSPRPAACAHVLGAGREATEDVV